MSTTRTKSSPNSYPSSPSAQQYDDSALEGVAANVKLLLKLIQDHKDACNSGKRDGRRMLRVAGMMTILDNVRTRIQKCQSFGNKKLESEIRQCYNDLKPNHVPLDKKSSGEVVADETESLRKQLSASSAARKSLEVMCSSLGKEKEIMASELAKKNYELSELEEHINDLKEQNQSLLEKVKEFAADHQQIMVGKGRRQVQGGNAAVQERNKELSEQLLKSLDGYRFMKRKLRETQEEALVMRETMEEISEKVGAGLQRVRGMKQQIETEGNKQLAEFEEGTSELEHVFQYLEIMVSKHGQRKGYVA